MKIFSISDGFIIITPKNIYLEEKDKMIRELKNFLLTYNNYFSFLKTGFYEVSVGYNELIGTIFIIKKEEDFIFGEAPIEGNVVYIKENDELVFDDLKFRVIETPGHSDGSVCYLIDNILFSGDTIFRGSYGRYDLPGGDGRTLMKSITEKLLNLDGKTIVYPGHGPSTTIEKEKIHYSYNY